MACRRNCRRAGHTTAARGDPERLDRPEGGAVADLAQLVGEVVAVERLPVTFQVEGGQGSIKIGELANAELAPLMGATGQPTTLHDSMFSTIPGSPAYL